MSEALTRPTAKPKARSGLSPSRRKRLRQETRRGIGSLCAVISAAIRSLTVITQSASNVHFVTNGKFIAGRISTAPLSQVAVPLPL